jgi:hypothetical protein
MMKDVAMKHEQRMEAVQKQFNEQAEQPRGTERKSYTWPRLMGTYDVR